MNDRVSKWNSLTIHFGDGSAAFRTSGLKFNSLDNVSRGVATCESSGMNLSLVVFALQVLVSVFSLLRESGEDESFAGDKLGYRS
jgi:hypothetical protein